MGQCKNCKFWKKDSCSNESGWCHCEKVWLALNYHPMRKVRDLSEWATHYHFGCVYFEERERGPFVLTIYEPARGEPREQAICFEPTGKEYPIGTAKKAEIICPRDLIEWLNEQWAERERECCGDGSENQV